MKMSCARPPILLRKQKSLVCESVCQPTINTRERRFRLQKQFSVDQNRDVVNNNHHSINGHHHQFRNGNLANNSWGDSNSSTSPEASLRIFTAIKNKSQSPGCEPKCDEVQKVSENGSTSNNKSRKKIEEKININIFLGQNTFNELDLGSDSEIGVRQPYGKLNNQRNANDLTTNEIKPMSNRLSAETRRSQFRQKSASLNEPRPRLMRAMSAPIRQNQVVDVRDKASSPNNSSATKKRLRRKKIAPIEINPFSLKIAQQPYSNKLVTQRSFDERPSTAKALSTRALKTTKPLKSAIPPRAKSAVNGCDIVTLVSLLSPGASDSEKEDYSNGTNDSTNERTAPSLRKIGKSVSFQDDDCVGDDEPVLDLPSVLRRASLVPLAAKIRLNRPPTAPPGSIFHKPTPINEHGMSFDKKLATTDISSDSKDHPMAQLGQSGSEISKVPINIMTATASSRKSSIDILDTSTVYPEYVRSIKEKECWILFQKMAKKGISVSYETILRGICTPSEVRAVEKKQKEIFERQASIELEATSAAECDTNKKIAEN